MRSQHKRSNLPAMNCRFDGSMRSQRETALAGKHSTLPGHLLWAPRTQTSTSTSFLTPGVARQHVRSHLEGTWDSDETKEDIDACLAQAAADKGTAAATAAQLGREKVRRTVGLVSCSFSYGLGRARLLVQCAFVACRHGGAAGRRKGTAHNARFAPLRFSRCF